MPFFAILIALLIGQLLYYQNTTMNFTFWLFLGLLIINCQKPIKEKVISFKNFPELSLVFSIIALILAGGFLTVYFFAGRFYLAEVVYKNALNQGNIQNLERAVNLNPLRIEYHLATAQAYFIEGVNEGRKAITEQDSIKIQNYIAKAIEKAKEATTISPNRVVGWEILGLIYREIKDIAAGATDWGAKSFEKALVLDPVNPALYTELGKLLVVDNPELAKEKFEKALELKPDYGDAVLQMALLLEKEDNLKEAIKKLEALVEIYPIDIDIFFQLGRMYYNDNRVDDAIIKFQQVIILFPNHSNAHYSLGTAYEKKGEINKAIAEFEKVLELNLGNVDVEQKLRKLRSR